MEFQKKYLKYKTKYMKLQKKEITNLLGGSYSVASQGITEKKDVVIYPEVSILLKEEIGKGGSGSVQLGLIIECVNSNLIGKKVAIKSFFPSGPFTPEAKKKYEKEKMTTFHLDEEDKIIENPLIASLYFDITDGPLKNCLVYEYGGNILSNYITSPYWNLNNNKRIMYQLFKIFYDLAQKDNMHNDVKCDNIVYSVDATGNVNIKLIDFGSSMSISALNTGKENFGRRVNMNTPETIYNHLLNNKPEIKKLVDDLNPALNNFNKWYYYPFISIICFIFTGRQYSTGGNGYINDLTPQPQPTKEHWKRAAYDLLINNENIKNTLKINTKEEFKSYLPQIYELIDNICKPIPSDRMSEDKILTLLLK